MINGSLSGLFFNTKNKGVEKMHILNWLGNWWLDILITVIGLALIAIPIIKAIRNGQKERVISLAHRAVGIAEQLYRSKTGQLKKDEALSWLMERSWIIRTFFSKSQLEDYIEDGWIWLNNLTDKEKQALLGIPQNE